MSTLRTWQFRVWVQFFVQGYPWVRAGDYEARNPGGDIPRYLVNSRVESDRGLETRHSSGTH